LKVFVHKVFQLFKWPTLFIYLNIIWVIFCAVGLMLFGFFPATIGLYTVVRKWVMGEREIPIWETFWHSYTTNFLRNGLMSAVSLLAGYALLVELNIFWSQENGLYYGISLAVIATFILYTIIMIYFFPLYVHYDSTMGQYIKMSMIMGIIHPFVTVGLLLLVVVFYLVFWTVPLLFILFGISVPAFIIMKVAYTKFPSDDKL